jgi:hypothetical protein
MESPRPQHEGDHEQARNGYCEAMQSECEFADGPYCRHTADVVEKGSISGQPTCPVWNVSKSETRQEWEERDKLKRVCWSCGRLRNTGC